MGLDVALEFDVDTGGTEPKTFCVYSDNYTHNCSPMAVEAGIYKYVWHPEECEDVNTAGDLIKPLRAGVKMMEDHPEQFRTLDPPNRWGSYSTFLPWLRNYLQACEENPKAKVRTHT